MTIKPFFSLKDFEKPDFSEEAHQKMLIWTSEHNICKFAQSIWRACKSIIIYYSIHEQFTAELLVLEQAGKSLLFNHLQNRKQMNERNSCTQSNAL